MLLYEHCAIFKDEIFMQRKMSQLVVGAFGVSQIQTFIKFDIK